MPVVIPLIGAAVGAAGSAASSAISSGAQSGAQKQALAAQQQAQQQALASQQQATAQANTAASQQQGINDASLNNVLGGQASQESLQNIQSQQGLLNALNLQGVAGQQQGLTGQLQAESLGQGPNPALAQLANTTGQNIQSQAALMAGQRGVGANAGLLARQIGQQGAGIQQNALGQAAVMRANQQLAAQQQLQQQLQSQMGQGLNQQQLLAGTTLNTLGQQIGAQQANNQLNTNLALGKMGAVQQANSLASNQQQQANQLASQQGQQSNLLNAQQQQNALGAGANALGSAITPLFGSHSQAPAQSPSLSTAQGSADYLNNTNFYKAEGGEIQSNAAMLKENYKGKSKIGKMLFASGGKAHKTVDALVSPGEKYISPKDAKAVKDGKKDALSAGKTIPGKPVVGGAVNSYANDTVHKKLKEGGIVLPRSVTQSDNPKAAANQFIEALKSKKNPKKGK